MITSAQARLLPVGTFFVHKTPRAKLAMVEVVAVEEGLSSAEPRQPSSVKFGHFCYGPVKLVLRHPAKKEGKKGIKRPCSIENINPVSLNLIFQAEAVAWWNESCTKEKEREHVWEMAKKGKFQRDDLPDFAKNPTDEGKEDARDRREVEIQGQEFIDLVAHSIFDLGRYIMSKEEHKVITPKHVRSWGRTHARQIQNTASDRIITVDWIDGEMKRWSTTGKIRMVNLFATMSVMRGFSTNEKPIVGPELVDFYAKFKWPARVETWYKEALRRPEFNCVLHPLSEGNLPYAVKHGSSQVTTAIDSATTRATTYGASKPDVGRNNGLAEKFPGKVGV